MLVTESTPFHPLDHTWPDQPADSGTITVAGKSFAVESVVTAAMSDTDDTVFVGENIRARRGESGWSFLVAHIVEAAPDASPGDFLGQEAALFVDSARRKQLNAAHSACHIAALALNKFTHDLWKKATIKDSLGHWNLDQEAIQRSEITTSESIDHYRLGKSLRKRGFDVAVFVAQHEEIKNKVGAQINSWIDAGGKIHVETEGPSLDSKRWWVCELSEGIARIPCGGTHLRELRELESVALSWDLLAEGPELTMHTVPVYRSAV